MNKMEILAPAGGPEAILPAVRCGADAVYLGAWHLSARASAQNFDREQLRQDPLPEISQGGSGIH